MSGTMRERTPGRWELRVYLGRHPATGRPQQVSRIFRGGKRAAAKALDALAVEVQSGRVAGNEATTLGKLLDEFLVHCERIGRSPSTIELYGNHIRKWIKPALGTTRLSKLSAYHLDRYYGGLEGKLAPKTIEVHHWIISGALTQANRWGWLSENPAKLASRPSDVAEDEPPPPPEQVRALIAKADEEGDHELALIVALLALMGCRRGELCGLRWEDMDAQRGTVHISRQIIPSKGGDIVRPTTKSRDVRTVALGRVGIDILSRYSAIQAERFPGWEPQGWLISYNGGETPLSPRRVTEHVVALGERCDPKIDVSPLSLRHFHATHLVGSGMDVRTVAGRMGHASAKQTLDTYSSFLPVRDEQAAEIVGSVIALGVNRPRNPVSKPRVPTSRRSLSTRKTPQI